MVIKCCMDQEPGDSPAGDLQQGTVEGSAVLFDSSKFIPLDPTQELIFPPALKVDLNERPSLYVGLYM